MVETGRIAVLSGDGIGPEVTDVACAVLLAVAPRHGLRIEISHGLLGGAAIEVSGSPLPDATLALVRESHAVLAGAVGGPAWDHLPSERNPGLGGMLRLRRELDLFANLRPAVSMPGAERRVDVLLIREAVGGAYFSEPRGRTHGPDGRRAFDTIAYTEDEIRRVVRMAAGIAATRRGRITSIDKANVLESSRLWREVAEDELSNTGLEVSHLYVDNAAYQLARDASAFDVIVTENMFGDILSDLLAGVVGSLGTLPSAGLGHGRMALYEPVHGSAPDIAGTGMANPLAAIRSAAMLLRYSFDRELGAIEIEGACDRVLSRGFGTRDLEGMETAVSTVQFRDLVLEELASGSACAVRRDPVSPPPL